MIYSPDMERTGDYVTSTELAFEIFNDFFERVGGRVDISDPIPSVVRHLSGGYDISLQRQDLVTSRVEATSPDGPIKFVFDKRGLIGAHVYNVEGVWREFLSSRGKAEFRDMSIPVILWTLDCFLQDRLVPIPEGVVKKIGKLSKEKV